MAKSPSSKKQQAAAANVSNLLAQAVSALDTNQPLWATHAEMASLVNYEGGALVECNEAMKQGDKVAWRATARGKEASQAGWLNNQGGGATGGAPTQQGANPSPASSGDASKFKFDDDIPVPEMRKGGRGSNAYGFEFMNVGQSFYIAATEENPNPAKRIASTVSGATRRLHPKTFIVRSVDETDKGRGKGARVFRTADSTEPKPE